MACSSAMADAPPPGMDQNPLDVPLKSQDTNQNQDTTEKPKTAAESVGEKPTDGDEKGSEVKQRPEPATTNSLGSTDKQVSEAELAKASKPDSHSTNPSQIAEKPEPDAAEPADQAKQTQPSNPTENVVKSPKGLQGNDAVPAKATSNKPVAPDKTPATKCAEKEQKKAAAADPPKQDKKSWFLWAATAKIAAALGKDNKETTSSGAPEKVKDEKAINAKPKTKAAAKGLKGGVISSNVDNKTPIATLKSVPKRHKEKTDEAEDGGDALKFKAGEKIDNRWVIVRKLGQGNFGAVFEALDATGQAAEPMALKIESREADDAVLKIEVAVLESMKADTKHVCRLYDCGKNDKYNYMLMTLLGPSLSVLRKHAPAHKFSLSTSVRLLLQCIGALRDLHNAGWLHRDIKPSNFAMGKQQRKMRHVYVFDFGLARTWRVKDKTKDKMVMRAARPKVGFRGTLRYCSINAHARLELGRHDDLISTIYTFVEMVNGGVPWKVTNDDKRVKKLKEKYAQSIYKGMPEKCLAMHTYVHSLKYEDRPDYKLLEESLLEIVEAKGYHSQPYDWEKTNDFAHFWNTAKLPVDSSQSSSLS